MITKKEGSKQINCSLVRDLLPNYVEHLTSQETNEFIVEHLNGCRECSEIERALTIEMRTDTVPKDQNVKKIMMRSRNLMLLKGILMFCSVIAIVTCFIVDVAVNHALTWSIIVDGGLFYAYAIYCSGRRSKNHKIKSMLAAISILILPYLLVIQSVVNANYVEEPIYWFHSYALPICLLWIGIVWVVVILQQIFHLNFWNVMVCLILGSFIGSPVTSMIATKLSFWEAYVENCDWIDTITYVVIGAACFIIGRIRKGKGMF